MARALRSGKVIYRGGSEGTLLENEWGKLLNAQYAIALANRTAALELALRAWSTLNDDVATTPRSFIAPANCAVHT